MPSKLDDLYASLPSPAKIGLFLWTYLAVSGWFSTYLLIRKVEEAWRNEKMFGTLLPENSFVWIAALMFLTSLLVIGLLFYGRYTRKKKDVIKIAVAKAQETGEPFKDPGLKFDYAVIPFWIGASVLTMLFSFAILAVALTMWDTGFDEEVLYYISGIGISFFVAIAMYLVSEIFANGVLDGKKIKNLLVSVIGAPMAQKVVVAFCAKVGIANEEMANKVWEKIKGCIKASEYNELTPDETILIQNAILEVIKKEGV